MASIANDAHKYRFLSEPDEALKCLICLEVAEEPWQQVDCGRLFCARCLEKYGRRQPCPNCRKEQPLYFPDNRSKREIKLLPVKCKNADRNCTWKGTVGTLKEHVSCKCEFARLRCPNHCNYELIRKDVKHHLKKECPNRDYECQYCGEKGTYKTITSVHDKTCEKRIVDCANAGCTQTMPRMILNSHVAFECEHTVVPCKHRSIGCDVKLKRKDMPGHELDDKHHLHMAIDAILEMRRKSDIILKHGEEMTFKLQGFLARKKKDEGIISLSFCTSQGSRLAFVTSHYGSAEAAHLSINIVYEKRQFLGCVTFTLLNQLENKNHYSRKIKVMSQNDRNAAGFSEFISLSDLFYNHAKNTLYLKDDTLYFRLKVEMENSKPWLECTANIIPDPVL